MFKFIANKNTEKGTTQLLLQKRNTQFSNLFKQVRNPVSILTFFSSIRKVYAEYFGDEDKSDLWLKVLIYVYDHGHFWQSDLKDKFGLTPQQSDSVLKRMGKRGLLKVDKTRNLYLYTLSADGHLFLKNFRKDCATAMVDVMKTVRSRPTKKKVFTTLKKKK